MDYNPNSSVPNSSRGGTNDQYRVPACDEPMFVFTNAMSLYDEESMNRHSSICDEICQTIESSPILIHQANDISIGHYVCGPSIEDARISILITCNHKVFEELHKILGDEISSSNDNKPDANLQNQPYSRSRSAVLYKGEYRLIFWILDGTYRSMYHTKGKIEMLSRPLHPSSSPKGILIRSSAWCATVTMVICVNYKFYALTVDHLFGSSESRPRNESQEFELLHDKPKGLGSDSILESNLDSINLRRGSEDFSHGTNTSLNIDDPARNTLDPSHSQAGVESDEAWLEVENDDIIVRASETLAKGSDWALIQLPFASYSQAVSLYTQLKEGYSCKNILSPPVTATSAVIIAGSSGVMTGTLLPGYSMLKSNVSRVFHRIYRIVMDDCREIIEGDCGALVLSRQTFDICGHVIASNQFGELLVSPILDTLNQICVALKTRSILLPRAVPLLVNLKNLDGWMFRKSVMPLQSIVSALASVSPKIDPRNTWFDDLQLQNAAGAGSLQQVQELIECGRDVNCLPVGFNGRTPLQAAAESGSLSVVELLLAAGANANAPSSVMGLTALASASVCGHLSIIDRLLVEGIDVNQESEVLERKSALSLAIEAKQYEAVLKLIDAGANVNQVLGWPFKRRYPITSAIQAGDVKMFNLLLAAGAKIFSDDLTGRPLIGAAESGNLEILDLVLEYSKGHDRGHDQALTVALEKKHFKAVESLVRANATLDFEGEAIVSEAIAAKDYETIEAIISAGLDLKAAEMNLRRRWMNEDFDSKKAEESEDDDEPESGISEERFLTTAVRTKEIRMIRLLLAAGVQVDEKRKTKESSLFLAAKDGDFTVVRLLLEAGATTRVRGAYSPIGVATERGHVEIVEILKAKSETEKEEAADEVKTPLSPDVSSTDGSIDSKIARDSKLKRDAIEETFRTEILPQCTKYINDPPAAVDLRVSEHRRLICMVLAQALYKLPRDDMKDANSEAEVQEGKNLRQEIENLVYELDEASKR